MTLPQHPSQFYIGGAWVDPAPGAQTLAVENPATEETVTHIACGTSADVDHATGAARDAWPAFMATPLAARIALLRRIHAAYLDRADDLAHAMTAEMGAPITFSHEAQVAAGDLHMAATIEAAERFAWEDTRGTTRLIREGIGVAALITPWNWPMNQIVCKVAPALAAGCTMVLKPSEIAPLSGLIFAEILHEAGVPPGVVNLVNGTGPEVGAAMSAHPMVDMVSFTGSTRAGVQVAVAAAPTVKRVAQELGGKSPNIILASADLDAAVAAGVDACMDNSGQSCDAPTRMFVPRDAYARALEAAAARADAKRVGDPLDSETDMGPLVSRAQFDKVQTLIEAGMAEGARLIAGGPGRPEGLNRGHFARPTVFGDVANTMTIAREEIFGPVLSVLPYDSVDDAVAMANDTVYGLAAYVQGAPDEARAVARRLQAGQVQINAPDWDVHAPFGGYKQSGNGREYADWAIHDFCELKALVGYGDD